MDPAAARIFLENLSKSLGQKDYLLIGFDLMKSPKLLYSAYNHPLFEKFNLHLLDRINQVLGADFNKKYFVQEGQYNPITSAVEKLSIQHTKPDRTHQGFKQKTTTSKHGKLCRRSNLLNIRLKK